MNLTATTPTQGGLVTAWASGSAQPGVTDLSFRAGQTVAALALVALGPDGHVRIANRSTGTTQVLADVQGYFVAGSGPLPAAALHPLVPTRVLDSATGLGVATLPGRADTTVTLTGRGGVPAGATAVLLELSTTGGTAAGDLAVRRPDQPVAPGSSLNFAAGAWVTNLVLAPLDAAGRTVIHNGSAAPVRITGDATAYLLAPGTAPPAGTIVPVAPRRAIDTRTGPGGPALAAGATRTLSRTQAGVPAGAAAVLVNITVTGPRAPATSPSTRVGSPHRRLRPSTSSPARRWRTWPSPRSAPTPPWPCSTAAPARPELIVDVVGYVTG